MSGLSGLGRKKTEEPAGLDFAPAAAVVEAEPVAIAAPIDSGIRPASYGAFPRVEVEAVIGGCLMRLHFEGTNPGAIHGIIKGFDANAKVRDDFPAKGGAFGKRETKRARLKAITLKATATGTFIDLVCKGEKTVSVTVSKKNADGFVAALGATGRVGAENLQELERAVDGKSQATVMLEAEEAVDVEYWTSEDGKAFMEAIHPGTVDQ